MSYVPYDPTTKPAEETTSIQPLDLDAIRNTYRRRCVTCDGCGCDCCDGRGWWDDTPPPVVASLIEEVERLRAENASLAAEVDRLGRGAMNRDVVCRGCWRLGNNCGACTKCRSYVASLLAERDSLRQSAGPRPQPQGPFTVMEAYQGERLPDTMVSTLEDVRRLWAENEARPGVVKTMMQVCDRNGRKVEMS